jgi:hypothetical protein
MRRSPTGVAMLVLALAIPASAAAETRYVATGGVDAPGCASPGAPCGSVGYAVGEASNGDTIQIGAGTFVESVQTDKVLTFTGAGSGTLDGIPAVTVIRGPAGTTGTGSTALELPNGGTVSSLRAQGGKGANEALTTGEPGGDGILFQSSSPNQAVLSLDRVVLVGGDGGSGKTPDIFERGSAGRGIQVNSEPGGVALSAVDSEFESGAGTGGGGAVTVDGPKATANVVGSKLRGEDPLSGYGITGFSGAQLTLDTVEVDTQRSGAQIYDGSMTIRRSRLQAGFPLAVTASSGMTATGELRDSLVISIGGTAAESESYDAGSTSSLKVIGSTIIGLFAGAAVRATQEEGSGPATVTLRNSIARHLAPPPFPSTDLEADRGTIDADFSSFTTRLEENGGTASAPGSAGNLSGDPLFIDPGKGNFTLQGTSPLIDRGNPGLIGAGEVDFAGSPRSLDGNRDCVAAPDIGAYEVTGQGVACDPAPTISKFGMTNKVFAPKGRKGKGASSSAKRKKVKRGTKFTYSLSEPATVKITIDRKKRAKKGKKAKFAKVMTLSGQKSQGRQSTPFSGRVKGRPLKPGKYRARITATDAAGQTSEPRQLAFRIVSG